MARVTITGNLTADPIKRATGGGDPVVSFDVADTARVYDREKSEWRDGDTLFLRCVAFRDLARRLAESAGKGTRVTVEGVLKPNNYEKDGQMRYGYVLEAEDVALSVRFASYVRSDAPQQSDRPSGRRVAAPADQPF